MSKDKKQEESKAKETKRDWKLFYGHEDIVIVEESISGYLFAYDSTLKKLNRL